MTLVLMEGFDHFPLGSGPEVMRKGWLGQGTVGSITTGRFPDLGSKAYSAHLNLSEPAFKVLPSTYSTLIVGFAFKQAGSERSVSFFELATATGARICSLRLNSSYQIELLDVTSAIVGTSSSYIVPGNWNYIELELTVGTSGTATVRLNELAEISAVTGNFGSTNIGRVVLTASALTASQVFDDIYAVDTTGSAPMNTFLGDVLVETLYPAADATHLDWTPDTGTDHYVRVNEHEVDGDTSVLTTQTANDMDTYQFDALGIVIGAVYGAQLNLYVRKNDGALRETKPVIRQSGTDYLGPTALALATDYMYQSWLLPEDPTSSDWTITTIDNDEYGIKLVT